MSNLEKSFIIAPPFRQVRHQGSSVPSRAQRNLMAMVEKPAPKFNAMMLLDHTNPMGSVNDIVKGLFADNPGQENVWTKFLTDNVHGSTNELLIRKALNHKMIEERLDAGLRKALFQRTMTYYKDLQKSLVQIVTPDDLQKAEARGGTYHKRVTNKEGKHQYFYDEAKYKESEHNQESGPDAQKSYISKTLSKMVDSHGDEGCGPENMKALTKKYGAKAVGDSLKNHCTEGGLHFNKGKFYSKKPKTKKPAMTAKVGN